MDMDVQMRTSKSDQMDMKWLASWMKSDEVGTEVNDDGVHVCTQCTKVRSPSRGPPLQGAVPSSDAT